MFLSRTAKFIIMPCGPKGKQARTETEFYIKNKLRKMEGKKIDLYLILFVKDFGLRNNGGGGGGGGGTTILTPLNLLLIL